MISLSKMVTVWIMMSMKLGEKDFAVPSFLKSSLIFENAIASFFISSISEREAFRGITLTPMTMSAPILLARSTGTGLTIPPSVKKRCSE